jgi:hypothetical protein
MSIPLFFPVVRYVPRLKLSARATSLRAICDSAGVICKASGAWTERVIDVIPASQLQIAAEPGDWSPVQISTSVAAGRDAARLALAALAYGLHDLVAKQSIAGAVWARISAPRGRIASGTALSVAARQRRFRARHPR